jgi:hypothetical protein
MIKETIWDMNWDINKDQAFNFPFSLTQLAFNFLCRTDIETRHLKHKNYLKNRIIKYNYMCWWCADSTGHDFGVKYISYAIYFRFKNQNHKSLNRTKKKEEGRINWSKDRLLTCCSFLFSFFHTNGLSPCLHDFITSICIQTCRLT